MAVGSNLSGTAQEDRPAAMGDSPADLAAAGPFNQVIEADRQGPVSLLTLLTRLLLVASAVTFFLYCMQKFAVTPDVYWLLRGGQYILSEGRLPATDIFSWTFADQPVLLYQWFFMVSMAAVEHIAGLQGVFFLFSVLSVGVYFLVPFLWAVPRKVPAFFVIVVSALGMAVITVNFSLRPMIITSALLLAQYMVVQQLRRDRLKIPAALAMTAVVYLLWANTHNGIVLGFGSLILFALGDVVERRGWYRFDPADPEIEGNPLPVGRYAILLVVGLLASLANPYGIFIYSHLVGFTSQSYFAGIIEELLSPNFHQLQFQWYLLFIAGLFLAMTRIRRLISAGDLLHLIVFTLLTLVVMRFVVWSVLFYILVMPRVLHHVTAQGFGAKSLASLRRGSAQTRRAVALMLGGLAVPFAYWVFVEWPATDKRCEDFAAALAAYQSIQQSTDRLFNSPGIGSCALAFEPYPKVFSDTRFDVYGEEFTRSVIKTLRLQPNWRDLLNEWKVNVALVETSWALAQILAVDPQAQIIYSDGKAVIARWTPKE
jgi:hypothetical protein